MKKMLVTGSGGFIGQNLCEFYKDKYCVYPAKRENITSVLDSFRPDVILHTASEIYDNDKMFKDNVMYSMDILEWCRENTIDKLVLFSSSSEYGRKNGPISENDNLEPQTIYESTKGAVSLLAQGYSNIYNIPTTILRLFTIVGRGEKPHKFFPTLYKKMKNNETLKLADGVHDFVFIDDFIKAVDIIINHKEEKCFNLVNVGSGHQTSNAEIVIAFESVFCRKYSIELAPKMRSFDTGSWVCDNRLLREKYGVDFLANSTKEEYLLNGIAKFIQDCETLNLYGN